MVKKEQEKKTLEKGPKKLYRSRTNSMIAGVAGGLAEYFEIDASIIRLLFVLTVFFGGFGIPFYIILWIILPVGPKDEIGSRETVRQNVAEMKGKVNGIAQEFRENKPGRGKKILAAILIGLGALFLLDNLGVFRGDIFWPALLIILGLFILLTK